MSRWKCTLFILFVHMELIAVNSARDLATLFSVHRTLASGGLVEGTVHYMYFPPFSILNDTH
jgi:hypothetical protein